MKTRRIALCRTSSLLVFVIASLTSALSFAKDDARLAALRIADLARFEAAVAADAKVLAALLDDDLEYVHSNGEVDTKASFIEALTTGRRDYLSNRASIESIRILGDVAIIRGRVLVAVADNGNTRDLDLGYTDVWVWKARRWQMTAWRSARMPPPVPTPVVAPAPAR